MRVLFDEGPEPSALGGFAHNPLVRDAEKRDAGVLQAALADPNARYHMFCGGKALVRKGKNPGASFTRAEIEGYSPQAETAVLLGHNNGVAHIATQGAVDEAALPETLRLYDMRSVLYSAAIGEAEAGMLAQAAAMLHWHETNRYCGRCGTATLSANGGFRRDCPSCEAQTFPRTDPVVIMLAVRGDACLLGRGRNFPPGWYSTLAGFVEPGETIEDAVRRETLEESGVPIGRVRYYASQPWPFPHSLMIGAFCEALGETIAFDASELEDCRWFTRAEVQAMLAGNHAQDLKSPPAKSIAHMLMTAFAAG